MRPIVAFLAAIACASPIASQPPLRGTLIVTNKAPATATLVDIASGRTLATLPTGQGPHEVVAARSNSLAVVSDYGAQVPGSTLTVIDVEKHVVVRTISLGDYRRPHGLVLLPGDTIVAVTSETHRAVLLVDILRGVIIKAVGTEQLLSHMVGVVANGTRAYTGNMGSNTVSELDLKSGAALRKWDVPPQPEAVNVTGDGREVWVGSNATGKVSAIDLSTGQVTTAAEGFGFPYRVLFTPNGELVLLPDYRNEELRFVERATRKELGRLSLSGGGPQGITMTPDGRIAFVSLSNSGKVAIIDITTRAVVREVQVGDTPDGVAYSSRTSG